ncbi:hypothetical protein [Histophilus somni]|uniref:hypothetical protein n=1 Tax=Histophilus somni TaxID=731 RepID=UPI00094AE851|nr:hypothetical protein [Histophilus somni]
MNIKYWKYISLLLTLLIHITIYYLDYLNNFSDDKKISLMGNLFTSSITLIGFIFAVIAILVTIADHNLIKKMRENGMYRQIIEGLNRLLIGFSLTSILSYVGLMLPDNLIQYVLLCTSCIFMFNLLMLVTDMFRRLTLTLINLNN